MKKKVILILLSDHRSTSEQILLKSLNFLKKKKNNYLFLGNSLFFKKLAKKTNIISKIENLDENKINFFDIKSYFHKKKGIHFLTNVAIDFFKKKKVNALINMPLNKKILGKVNGFTEYFAKKIGQYGKENMLLFNDELAVCPLTTHVPLANVPKLLSQKKIFNAVNNINKFYKNIIKKKIKIKICGLNPHAGKDFYENNIAEKKIITPSIKKIEKKYKNITGPHSADTVFLNYKNTVILGMYHDQVLAPFKALKNFDAINITIGLKYLRLSPDHGTGLNILNKKEISNTSFKKCVIFCEKYFNV